MKKVDQAVSYFKQGFLCSQAILATYGEPLGLDRNTALKIAEGFGGGMASMGETCGAVTGAFMVIGLKHGRTEAQDREARHRTHELVREFTSRFASRNASIVCRNLLGCDINTPEGTAMAREKGLFTTVCPKLVGDAAEILEELGLGE